MDSAALLPKLDRGYQASIKHIKQIVNRPFEPFAKYRIVAEEMIANVQRSARSQLGPDPSENDIMDATHIFSCPHFQIQHTEDGRVRFQTMNYRIKDFWKPTELSADKQFILHTNREQMQSEAVKQGKRANTTSGTFGRTGITLMTRLGDLDYEIVRSRFAPEALERKNWFLHVGPYQHNPDYSEEFRRRLKEQGNDEYQIITTWWTDEATRAPGEFSLLEWESSNAGEVPLARKKSLHSINRAA